VMPDDLTEAIHRCLVVGFDRPAIPDGLKRLLDRGLGGVILHTRNIADAERLRDLTDELRAHRPDLLIGIDQEGAGIGHLARAKVPDSPGSWALGAADDTGLTAAMAGALAAHLAALGVTVEYAPVADVQREPANPIVRTRAFGSDPELVARHVTAWTEATLAAGVAACAKHFPGHGSTTIDSHMSTAVDARDLATIRSLDVVPFEAAIAAGVPLVMTAHVVYPALDTRPATLSHRILSGLLRDDLGYQGVIVTDALEMKAIADEVGEADGSWMALAAGADQLIVAEPDPDLHVACAEAIAGAITSGSLAESRITDAASRIAALAARFAAPPPRRDADVAAGRVADMTVGLAAARRAVRWAGLSQPVRRPFVVDMFRPPHPALEWDRSDLVTHVRALLPDAEGVSVNAEPVDVADVLRRAAGRPLVVATEDADLHAWQRDVRADLVAARPDAVLVATGLPDAGAGLCSFGRGRVNLIATAELLAGVEPR